MNITSCFSHLFRFFSKDTQTKGQRAFTLLEIIIVISLIAVTYTIAAPNMGLNIDSEVANTLGRLNADVRTAFDLAILNRRNYRLVFQLQTGNYWLEDTETQTVYLGNAKSESDPSKREEAEKKQQFETSFAKYEELVGDVVSDPDGDEKVARPSMVLRAKSALRKPKWTKVETPEWLTPRSLGPHLIIKDMQAEHHSVPTTAENLGPEAFAFIHFLPAGYVERAYLHLYYRLGNDGFNLDKTPYTVITHPHRGESEINNGIEEVDLQKVDDES